MDTMGLYFTKNYHIKISMGQHPPQLSPQLSSSADTVNGDAVTAGPAVAAAAKRPEPSQVSWGNLWRIS